MVGMVSIYSFGRQLSLPDIDEDDMEDEDVGIQILDDGNGRRYSFNPVTEETKWVDNEE